MKCSSCSSIIKKEWKFALTQNVCPCCGQPIMDEEMKDLHFRFTDVMTALVEKEYLPDWMSNYGYFKSGTKIKSSRHKQKF
jgi:hypothetical protein